ncbi:sterile alpha motif domain-containing protein 1-like [Colius striatus]|uniref:sterile alpha motif domain-containing protein 1-like n=1 Tax=Colius striatus TaxID=57412 RepID=UPI002B1DFE0B|nr:sterile alpha motif domain-containing protein 1-like [Colius striatus]
MAHGSERELSGDVHRSQPPLPSPQPAEPVLAGTRRQPRNAPPAPPLHPLALDPPAPPSGTRVSAAPPCLAPGAVVAGRRCRIRAARPPAEGVAGAARRALPCASLRASRATADADSHLEQPLRTEQSVSLQQMACGPRQTGVLVGTAPPRAATAVPAVVNSLRAGEAARVSGSSGGGATGGQVNTNVD